MSFDVIVRVFPQLPRGKSSQLVSSPAAPCRFGAKRSQSQGPVVRRLEPNLQTEAEAASTPPLGAWPFAGCLLQWTSLTLASGVPALIKRGGGCSLSDASAHTLRGRGATLALSPHTTTQHAFPPGLTDGNSSFVALPPLACIHSGPLACRAMTSLNYLSKIYSSPPALIYVWITSPPKNLRPLGRTRCTSRQDSMFSPYLP
jgi:hypothetical protein